jgi:hypothetical protein
MKYPKLTAKWQPADSQINGITHQAVKIYMNGELITEKGTDPYQDSVEFFVPAWDFSGKLIADPTETSVTVQAFSDNFASEIISSEPIQLSSLAIESPSNLEVFVMPFPENYQEYEVPVVLVSGVI